MDYLNVCQVCCFCKKGSHVFKVDLKCFDDVTGEVIINPIQRIHLIFNVNFAYILQYWILKLSVHRFMFYI